MGGDLELTEGAEVPDLKNGATELTKGTEKTNWFWVLVRCYGLEFGTVRITTRDVAKKNGKQNESFPFPPFAPLLRF